MRSYRQQFTLFAILLLTCAYTALPAFPLHLRPDEPMPVALGVRPCAPVGTEAAQP